MTVFRAAALIALLAGPAYAQSQSVPKYGEVPKDKSPQEKAAEQEAEKAQAKVWLDEKVSTALGPGATFLRNRFVV